MRRHPHAVAADASAVTGAAAWYFFNRRVWTGFALSLFAHGTVHSFLAGLATHELSHGTVFKTKWLNGVFLRVLSLVFMLPMMIIGVYVLWTS